MCLQTKQRKSEKTCAKEQPGGGLNAAINTDIKFSSRDNGPDVGGGETFLSLSSTVLLFHVTSGTAVSFSYHMVAGLHPGMCHVPVAPLRCFFHTLFDYTYNDKSCVALSFQGKASLI